MPAATVRITHQGTLAVRGVASGGQGFYPTPKGIPGRIPGGWTASGFETIQSGAPVTPEAGEYTPPDGKIWGGSQIHPDQAAGAAAPTMGGALQSGARCVIIHSVE